MAGQVKQRLLKQVARIRLWVRGRVPPGLRWSIGVLFAIGGVFSFLPVLGIWMLPLGLAIIAMDVRPLWNRLGNRGKNGRHD